MMKSADQNTVIRKFPIFIFTEHPNLTIHCEGFEGKILCEMPLK